MSEHRLNIEDANFKMRIVNRKMKPDELLSQTGWFYLKDVFSVLDPHKTGKYKLAFKQIERLIERGEDPFEVMGRRKFGGRVGILMERFAPWYRENLIFKAQKLNKVLSFQDFLKQRDCYFRLSELCKTYEPFLPYSYAILKRNADKQREPLKEMGIIKFDTTYLVALPRFGEWLKTQIMD